MTTITVDGLNEEEFRRSIERAMRQGQSDEAIARLRGLLEPFAGPGRILPERFLTIDSSHLALHGWEGLAARMARHDRPGRPVSALSIAFGWPGEDVPQPDAAGCLTPLIETGYYTDDAFPFSQSARDDLLDGYSLHGCSWSNDYEGCDHDLTLAGVDDLHGALAALEARLLVSEEPDDEEIRAGSLGACLLSVLLFQAVGKKIASDGLPRPVCVLAGSNGVYPYFDAPVVGIPEEALKAAEAAEEEELVVQGAPAPRYSSLLVTGIPRARKRAVLVLDESEDEMAVRIAALRGMHREEPTALVQEAAALSEPAGIEPMATGPLLAKKPSGQHWDFRDMLSPKDVEPPQDLPPAAEPADDEPWFEQGFDMPPPVEPPARPPVTPFPDTPFEHDAFAPRPSFRLPQAEPIQFDPPPVEPLAPAPVEAEAPPLPPPPLPMPVDQQPVQPETIAPEPIVPEPPIPEFPRAEPVARAPESPVAPPAPRPRFPSQSTVGPGFISLEPELQDRLESLLAPHLPAQLRPERAPEPQPEPAAETDEVPAAKAPDIGPVWPLGLGWLEESESVPVTEVADEAVRPGLWSRLRSWLGRR